MVVRQTVSFFKHYLEREVGIKPTYEGARDLLKTILAEEDAEQSDMVVRQTIIFFKLYFKQEIGIKTTYEGARDFLKTLLAEEEV